MARKERYLVGLDVGTSKVTAVVGEMLDEEGLDIVGLGVAESRGIRRGVVVNLEAAVDSIKKAIEEAELMAGVEIDSVHLALSGPHIKGFNSHGVVAVISMTANVAFTRPSSYRFQVKFAQLTKRRDATEKPGIVVKSCLPSFFTTA